MYNALAMRHADAGNNKNCGFFHCTEGYPVNSTIAYHIEHNHNQEVYEFAHLLQGGYIYSKTYESNFDVLATYTQRNF